MVSMVSTVPTGRGEDGGEPCTCGGGAQHRRRESVEQVGIPRYVRRGPWDWRGVGVGMAQGGRVEGWKGRIGGGVVVLGGSVWDW